MLRVCARKYNTKETFHSTIPKTDSPVSEKDYCPISILAVLSKIFERLVLKQLTSYIDQQTILAYRVSQDSVSVTQPQPFYYVFEMIFSIQ